MNPMDARIPVKQACYGCNSQLDKYRLKPAEPCENYYRENDKACEGCMRQSAKEAE